MVEISTSLLSAKKNNIVDTIKELEKAKTNYFHIDVMDGEFVNREPIDIHLMVKDIKNYVDSYKIFQPNIITFHYEACKNKEEVKELIDYIKTKVRRVGISIKPETPVSEIYEFLPYVHIVLVMTVEPGKGGQILIPETIDKIRELNKYREENELNYDIEADGGINLHNSNKLIDAGADILVAGTAITSSKDYKKTIMELKH